MKTDGYWADHESLTRRNFLRVAGGALATLSLPILGSLESKAKQHSINVGGIFSLTGPNAPVGKTIRDGAQLAVEKINDKGGIGGEVKLNLVVEDGETSQTGASKAARRLANRDDISFVFGPLIGTHGMATQSILGAAGIPQVFFGTVPGFTERHEEYPLSIRYGTQVKLEMAPVLKYAVEQRKDEKLYLLAPNNQQGESFEKVVRHQLKRVPAGELVGVETYTPFSGDFSTLVTKAVNSSADGVIVGTGIPAALISVAREYDRRGIDPKEFGYYTGQTPNGSVDFERQVAEKGIGDGVIYAWHYENKDYGREFERSQPPAQATEMESAFVDEFGHPPDSPPSASWGWGSVYIVKQAIEGLVEEGSKEAVLSLDRSEELPEETMKYLLPPTGSDSSGPPVKTPYGNYGFLSCGQFDIRLGVATFEDNERYLVKDRGYGEELIGKLCS
ncbi:MAG: ABC transporter substrate-binding protein [Candidatus Bipolaricaulota bacterium]|nr:ABC transporter substrate-binding protein [Candidatus Bipolaricaulota bacterium]MBS3792308.1 ABC transporter substrate-binding protein [Candidatus Bipolaricaulota bacterium]